MLHKYNVAVSQFFHLMNISALQHSDSSHTLKSIIYGPFLSQLDCCLCSNAAVN